LIKVKKYAIMEVSENRNVNLVKYCRSKQWEGRGLQPPQASPQGSNHSPTKIKHKCHVIQLKCSKNVLDYHRCLSGLAGIFDYLSQ